MIHTLAPPPRDYNGYTLRVEPVAACLEEFKPLCRAQWDEIEEDRPPFDPDWARFLAMDEAGTYFQVTARHGGELVGGVGFVLYPSLHTRLWSASESAFYLKPDHRKGLLASALLRYAEEVGRVLGIAEVTATVKSYANTGALLKRLGFRQTDTVWQKQLTRENDHV